MLIAKQKNKFKISIVIPCYNEENTLEACVANVLSIADETLDLEIIIVDDCSKDASHQIALELQSKYPEVLVLKHDKNSGKGAALRTGFKNAGGDFVAVQDADLEYDPQDLRRLLVPLIENKADVVLGSRFLSCGSHRVLYFWHYLGNRFLTLLSNMFTDLNLTDMETCYKVFRREVIQQIQIRENRFGFEPEIVAKVAHMRLGIYEMGISYFGRTYAEGKKIGVRDGFRALYCIFRYNAHKAPLPIQFMIYLAIGGLSAVLNLISFLFLNSIGVQVGLSAFSSFLFAAAFNYALCILILFRHRARWNSFTELAIYIGVVLAIAAIDVAITKSLIAIGLSAVTAKSLASFAGLVFNFLGRRIFVFPEPASGPWAVQVIKEGS